MFSAMEQLNKVGSCDTMPRFDLTRGRFRFLMSLPSRFNEPLSKS